MQITSLKLISDKREKDFNKLGIYTVEDLVRHFPKDYLDLRNITPISQVYHNDVVLTCGEVLTVECNKYSRRPYVRARCRQGDCLFTAIWFNQVYVADKLRPGEFLFYGRVQNKFGLELTIVNPTFEPAEKKSRLQGIIPVYSLSGKLTQKLMRYELEQALEKLPLASCIPYDIQRRYELMKLKDAYRKVHFPETVEDYREGANRIALEEYFLLISAFKVTKGGSDDARLNTYSVTREELDSFISRFPFTLTPGQIGAVQDIWDNMKGPHRMNRLIQGDVGSGKTAVAMTAMYMAVKSGYQAAMLAPTEVLAQQNASVLRTYFPEYNVVCLTGSMTAKEKKFTKALIEGGMAHIVCGTHAILQEDVFFSNLSLVVCDEQQRFGVAQRASLANKGESCDVIVMSATPIPRTLSLIWYGDLDITTIKDKPKDRQEISTSIIPERKYTDMLRYVAEQAKKGCQTYFVCPKIEEDEEGTIMSVTELYEDLKTKMPDTRFALLHGKMKEKDKNAIMEDFKAKKYDCLVSTTVIEVGVDVPDATIMIIYNAERFGLSQLHQLRGRVGRSSRKSYCFLLMGVETEEARRRLTVLKTCSDGFRIAEEDLKIRGGGDFLGTRQSGRMLSEIKNLKFPVETIFTAKALVDEAFSSTQDLTQLKTLAAGKYESLKDIVLN
ncbi:MAG: ATP-dependent DNA helicase RecG [Clostridia bacterium]|nr:ATP-dependent DNA helicase RecG [Clostridia bacterium]